MNVTGTLRAPIDPGRLFEIVDDLSTYPQWLEIVARAVPEADGSAWSVDLRGQLGPLRRSKRLRMVRTVSTFDGHHGEVRFERREPGRSHSAWVLQGEVERDADDAVLTMRLHYGGSMWLPILDRVLRDEIERSRPRLIALVEAE
ncbi:MAG: SRPBCC family protein [Microthrixaceae bacterium]|jgi:hypothetical protein|nr:SRPBCC family protein [Microthrixaceae bacterium]